MGQRLVIQITDNDVNLANAYYHWSAYTGSSAALTKEILDIFDHVNKDYTPVQKAVWYLVQTGARFAPDEITNMEKDEIDMEQFKFAFDDKTVNRNDGLLCVTEEGMDNNTSWEEGRVEIDITRKLVHFDVIGTETAEEYTEYNKDWEDAPKVEDLPVFDVKDCFDFTFCEFYSFYDKLTELLQKCQYTGISKDRTTVFEFIE